LYAAVPPEPPAQARFGRFLVRVRVETTIIIIIVIVVAGPDAV
jgi:hypothetical protein